MSRSFLEEKKEYFENPENATTFDVAWPFEPNDSRVVFDRMRSIIQVADQYRLTNAPFEAFKFEASEISELVSILQASGYLTGDRTLPGDKIQYFLNVANALKFTLQAFEDYNKDVFFVLHALAKQIFRSALSSG